ncbi:uncharacterized protein LOC122622581 [Drosophila teissieri]|uniref:uncharacterized protein LOC122622581 n=1 Tax=Drosophila teissieri TaxID=7243 RepID=UPI001CB9EE81|nr:uncharacterized protein LOC122622581 [Drosophila teissieri]
MFVLPAVGATITATATAGSRKSGYSNIASRKNVMQHSPVVVFMCVQHSQQQVPMLNNFMCMRMRGWHNIKYYCNNLINIETSTIGTGTGGTTGTTGTKILRRSKLLRKKRDFNRRRFIRRTFC